MGEQLAMPAFRRNGKKPSCEPCRKSKYSCDHVTPVCGRCQRRGIATKCSYHPAPMKGLTPKITKPHSLPRSLPTPPSNPQQGSLPVSPMAKAHLTTPSSQLAWEVSVRDPPQAGSTTSEASPISLRTERSGSRAAPIQEHGFLGSTSYNAVFTDNIDTIGLEEASEVNANPSLSDKLHAQITALQKWPHRLKDAVTVLRHLQDFTHLQKIAEKWWQFDRSMALIGPWVAACEEGIRTELIDSGALRSEESMIAVAEQLFANTEEAIVLTKDLKFHDFASELPFSIRLDVWCSPGTVIALLHRVLGLSLRVSRRTTIRMALFCCVTETDLPQRITQVLNCDGRL